jgi:hypothetical protein
MINQIRKINAIIVVLFALSAVNATTGVNYDTAWTFVYDGGKSKSGKSINDDFHDVKSINRMTVCVGSTTDSSGKDGILLVKLDSEGKIVFKKLLRGYAANLYTGGALAIAKNGDFLIGGLQYAGPWIVRTDTLGNVKWSTWYYDSINSKPLLSGGGTVNSILETTKGKIVCAAGDEFPNNGGYTLNNYAAYLELDSNGVRKRLREWSSPAGYKIAGFSIDETNDGDFLMAGNQAVFYLDTTGKAAWQNNYTFWLEGVGTEVNNITRAKKLRDGTLMVAGQAYEGNCWSRYNKLYYDAWWSPITTSGSNTTWDTAGTQGVDDYLFDFTQLINGNLVFVGTKGGENGNSSVWTIVTDSTGKKILWEKQFIKQTSSNFVMYPMAVTSSSDSGFTVAGWGAFDTVQGKNAFAMHFVPKDPTPTIPKNIDHFLQGLSIITTVSGSKVSFVFNDRTGKNTTIYIYDAAGRPVAGLSNHQGSSTPLTWDCSKVSKGVYLYKARMKDGLVSGEVVISR